MAEHGSNFLTSGVDLSALARPTKDNTDDTPGEFTVAIVGDQRGRPHVMLAFGHLQWIFEPQLAADLGAVLADAAQQAAVMPAQGPTLSSAAPAGTLVEVPR